MQNAFENLNSAESFNTAAEAGISGLDSYRGLDASFNFHRDQNKSDSTMSSYEGNSGFVIVDGSEEVARSAKGRENFEPLGNENEKEGDDERERGEKDVQWAKELLGAHENNADAKDLKESLGRVKPNEMTAVYNELKNLTHDEAMQILKEKFDKMAGADKGISPQELANEFESDKNPKNRAACIYATRHFDAFAKAANLLGGDWTGPVIDRADLDHAKKPGP